MCACVCVLVLATVCACVCVSVIKPTLALSSWGLALQPAEHGATWWIFDAAFCPVLSCIAYLIRNEMLAAKWNLGDSVTSGGRRGTDGQAERCSFCTDGRSDSKNEMTETSGWNEFPPWGRAQGEEQISERHFHSGCLRRSQLSRSGHLVRMPSSGLPGEVFQACAPGGSPRGRLRRIYISHRALLFPQREEG